MEIKVTEGIREIIWVICVSPIYTKGPYCASRKKNSECRNDVRGERSNCHCWI